MLLVRGEFVLRIVRPPLCTRWASIMCASDVSCRALGTDQETSRLGSLPLRAQMLRVWRLTAEDPSLQGDGCHVTLWTVVSASHGRFSALLLIHEWMGDPSQGQLHLACTHLPRPR